MKPSKTRGIRKRNRRARRYPLHRAPLFRLERKKDLAKLLNVSGSALHDLIKSRQSLYIFRNEITNGKSRELSIPIGKMRRIHERIFRLISRIELPEYIRSPRKKSTSWGNAILHAKSDIISTFDIKGFYPSTTEEHIFRFFHYRLEMSADTARIMALLCSVNGKLPLGSPMSPHLACLSHLDLFSDAADLAQATGHRISVWVDDVAISGRSERRDIVNSIRRRAAQKGLVTHKFQRGSKKRGAELTGTFIRDGKVVAVNAQNLKILQLTKDLSESTDPHDKHALVLRILAQYYYLKSIAKAAKLPIGKYTSRIAYYKRKRRAIEQELSVTYPLAPAPQTVQPDTNLPWSVS